MKKNISFFILALASVLAVMVLTANTGCVYKFTENAPLPDSIRTIRVELIENRAPYINAQLAPTLTDRIRQKIVNQTKLRQTNNDGADLVLRGQITDYSVSTSGISQVNGRPQPSTNRLTVTVQVTYVRQAQNLPDENHTVSRQFDFASSKSLQRAEAELLDEIVRNLTDEIFNSVFSKW